MKQITLLVAGVFFLPITGWNQQLPGKLTLKRGTIFHIATEVKTTVSQEAMGQAIDFTASGIARHSYNVIDTAEGKITVHHEITQINFEFDGMGQKRTFNSENKSDMAGPFGPAVKDLLSKTYDVIIDSDGKVLQTRPEKSELARIDDKLAIVLNMLKDLTSLAYPPKKNEASFFKILPDKHIGLNEGWTEAREDSAGKFNTAYTLSAINDSIIILDLKGNSVTSVKGEMMGQHITTLMNNNHTGKIILDKSSGFLREKRIFTESNGTTEALGGTLPVTSKTTLTVSVVPN